MARRSLFAALLLSIVLCTSAQPEPQHWYKLKPEKPLPLNAIYKPQDFLTAWSSRVVPAYISPCLAIAITYSKDYVYNPGFDLMWFSGFRTIRQFLKWNKEFDGSSPAKRREDLTLYIAGSQGFIGSAGDTGMLFFVWDQCALEAATKTQRQVPGVAYFADYIVSKYGIEVPDQVLRQEVFEYWPSVVNELYGAGCDRVCLSNTKWSDAATTVDCGCNAELISELKRFSVADPSGSTPAKPTPNTRQCLQLLNASSASTRAISIYSFRAAINFCFNAFPLNTGNGLGWRPAGGDGYEPGFFELLSFPEYVQPNYSPRRLRSMAGLVYMAVL